MKDMFTDLKDGRTLLDLLEGLTGKPLVRETSESYFQLLKKPKLMNKKTTKLRHVILKKYIYLKPYVACSVYLFSTVPVKFPSAPVMRYRVRLKLSCVTLSGGFTYIAEHVKPVVFFI